MRKHGVYYDSRIKLLLILLTSALAFALGGGLTGLLLFGVVCLFALLSGLWKTSIKFAIVYACSFCGCHMDIVPTNIILRRIYFMQTENKKGFQVKDLIVTALVVVAICAFVGALNAKKLLKKHFKKAGMV